MVTVKVAQKVTNCGRGRGGGKKNKERERVRQLEILNENF
jgi:hypothetical protein